MLFVPTQKYDKIIVKEVNKNNRQKTNLMLYDTQTNIIQHRKLFKNLSKKQNVVLYDQFKCHILCLNNKLKHC